MAFFVIILFWIIWKSFLINIFLICLLLHRHFLYWLIVRSLDRWEVISWHVVLNKSHACLNNLNILIIIDRLHLYHLLLLVLDQMLLNWTILLWKILCMRFYQLSFLFLLNLLIIFILYILVIILILLRRLS
jgi:hypothetical protein